MIIGILEVELLLNENRSLKEKRRVLKSLKDKIKNKFNVSICEVGHHEKWQRSVLAFVNAGNSSRKINSNLTNIVQLIYQLKTTEVIEYRIEMI